MIETINHHPEKIFSEGEFFQEGKSNLLGPSLEKMSKRPMFLRETIHSCNQKYVSIKQGHKNAQMVYNKIMPPCFCRNHLVTHPWILCDTRSFEKLTFEKNPWCETFFATEMFVQISKHVITSPKINMGSPMKYWFPKRKSSIEGELIFRWSRPETFWIGDFRLWG